MNQELNDQTYAIFETAANRKIIGDLTKSGAKIWLFPPLETHRVELSASEIVIFANLKSFDWLIFSDVFAVDYFLENLENEQIDFYELDDLRVCANGEAVSDRLRFASIHADVIPPKRDAATVGGAIIEYVGEREFGDLKFLYLRGDDRKDHLAEQLRTEKIAVVELPIYGVNVSEDGELTKLKTLVIGGAIDEFIFTAPEDLIALEYYFARENLAAVLNEIVVSATDSVMIQTVKEYDLARAGLFRLNKVGKVNE